MKREPRLHFSDADLAEPKLKKPIKRVEKAAAKADKAQAKIPKKTVVKKERGFDPATGKVKTHLRFEEVDKKKPPSKLTHAAQDAPANLVLSQFHREVQQSEDDNVGVESAHKLEGAAESGGRLIQSAHRSYQLKPYRAAARAETRLEKANIDALQKKAQIEHPTSNPVSKWQQKQAIKKQYVAAKYGKTAKNTAKTTENTTKAAKKAAEKTKQAGQFVWRHRKGFAIAAALFLMLAFFLNGLSSCSVLLEGAGSGIVATTYPSQDADVRGAEAAYKAKYTKQAEDIKESIRVLKEKLTDVLENRSERNRWISQFTQFATLETLDRRALIHMVQSIRVMGKKELAIAFTYEDEYKKALQLIKLAAQNQQTEEFEHRKAG